MNFQIMIFALVLTFGFVGSAFGQLNVVQNFSEEEIEEMKQKAVLITLETGQTFFIEFFPKDAPNHVSNFLELVDSGYYDGTTFHRIIPGFMIQGGDPNTKGPESDRSKWGQGGTGYHLNQEFNTLQHDRGIVSMARGQHVDSASSQFFIMHKDTPSLDGQYTAFGRLIPVTGWAGGLDHVASLLTDGRDAPIDASEARIKTAEVIDEYSSSTEVGMVEPDRNTVLVKDIKVGGGTVQVYYNELHQVRFDLPYRWEAVQDIQGPFLNIILEPHISEHNVQAQIEQSGFTPQVIITSEAPTSNTYSDGVNTGFFSITGGDEPVVLSNYIFQNTDGKKAHMMITTQYFPTEPEPTQFKIIQFHINENNTNYSIVYVNVTEWFRYEVMAFKTTVDSFETMIDGKVQSIGYASHPVFQQIIADSKEKPQAEALPPVRVGDGCLIATASYGSELAPQVQLLREIRDNTVLQTESGAAFMTSFNQFYYSFSPTVADYERENATFKEAVKLTLTPLLASLTLLQHVDIDSEHEMLGYGISIIFLNIGIYFIIPAVLIMKIRSFYKLQ